MRKDNIITGIDGKQWIQKRRTKTNVLSNIPILDMPKRILKKYANHDKVKTGKALLPIPSNQKMNAYLKEIADLCGINKKLMTPCCQAHFCNNGNAL